MNYTMALVPGYRIQSRADQQAARNQIGLNNHSQGPENRCKYASRVLWVRGINRKSS